MSRPPPPTDSVPSPTESDSFPNPFERQDVDDDGDNNEDDVEKNNGHGAGDDAVIVPGSLREDVHSLPTVAEMTGKRETDAVSNKSGGGSGSGYSVYRMLVVVIRSLFCGIVGVGIGLGLAYGLKKESATSSQQSIQDSINTMVVPPNIVTNDDDLDDDHTNLNVYNDSHENAYNKMDTTDITPLTAEEREREIKAFLVNKLFGAETAQELGRSYTGQYQAFRWITHEDTAQYALPTTPEAEQEFLGRYIMAVLYYATHGDKWTHSLHFLSEEHICAWFELVDPPDPADANTSYQDQSLVLDPSTANIASGKMLIPRGIACDEEGALLKGLFLDNNNLYGTLPNEIGLLSTLEILNLDVNVLSGHIPKIGKLSNLKHLTLAHNQLTGIFVLYNLMTLETIDLSYNYLTGTIPSLSTQANSLTALAMDHNLLVGEVASKIHNNNHNIEYLYVEHNNLTETLDDAFLIGCTQLKRLDMSDNQIVGTVPIHLLSMTSLEILDLHNNFIGGTLPIHPPMPVNTALTFLALHGNQITGTIPLYIKMNLPVLSHLDVSRNQLNGTIPLNMGAMDDLTYLFLAENNFRPGPIPLFFSRMTGLVDLSLKNTQRTGTIPDFFGPAFTQMVLLDLDNNELRGTIPRTVAEIPELQFLLLNNNLFSGTVPTQLAELPALRLLFIDGNELEGNINELFCTSEKIGYYNNDKQVFIVADCGGSTGRGSVDAEITCDCCIKCCSNNEPCNDATLVPSNDLSWQFGYDRQYYDFDGYRLAFFT